MNSDHNLQEYTDIFKYRLNLTTSFLEPFTNYYCE